MAFSDIAEKEQPPSREDTSDATLHDTDGKPVKDEEAQIQQANTEVPAIATTIPPLAPPPDGGRVAWSQVLAAHLVVFNTWGFVISYGIFQPYYVKELGLDASAISWIGSVQICLIVLVGVFSGRMFDAGYGKTMLVAGAVTQLVGIFTTSVSHEYWQFFLSQGLCQGIGCGLVFAPTIANVSSYFVKKRTMAISLGACGGGTGGIVFPLMARQLLPHISFGWTLRAMGLVELVSYIIVLLLVRTRLPPRRSGPLVELAAFKELPFSFFAMGMFFTLWATFFTYFYARAYAIDRLGGDASTSFNMLMVINVVGIPGRLIPAFIADKYFDALTLLIPTVLGAGICVFAWAGVTTIGGQYGWIIFIGYFAAGIQSLFPSTIASLSPDLSKVGTRIGMIFAICSIPNLTGPPLAGRLIAVGGGSYLGAQIWGGVCLFLGAALLFVAKYSRDKK